MQDAVYEDVEDRQCTNCHYEDEVWSYHHPSNRRYYVGDRYSDWEYYYQVPWWYESYWYYTPPATRTVPLPGRSFRPGDGSNQPGTTGGTVSHPPGMKSQGSSVRTTAEDDEKKGEKNEPKSKDRTVRPKGKKEKEDG